ncbi:MAG: hypothetical protein JNL81_08665 [Hyphomonadaceae bacterium]|nr:hypothetical protein [Hyphomonadaceae bacterium]
MWIALAWLMLALIHTPPALATFLPALRRRMYGVDAGPALDVILAHRGVLFLAVAVVCAYAAYAPEARRAASLVAALSVLGFLALYALARFPNGPLRSIAVADAIAVVPLVGVTADAWRVSI